MRLLGLILGFILLPLAAYATPCNIDGSMPSGTSCTVAADCTLSNANSVTGQTCESCSATSSAPGTCVQQFASNTTYSEYCSTATSTTQASWTEIWCASPGESQGPNSTADCTLANIKSQGLECSQCDVTSSDPGACVTKYANTDLSEYCSTATSTSDTSYSEIWCAPPGSDQLGPVNNCSSTTPSLLATVGLGLLMFRRRRTARQG